MAGNEPADVPAQETRIGIITAAHVGPDQEADRLATIEGLDGILRHCREHLADFKVPRQLFFVTEIPRTATGKVLKHVLREPYWRGYDRRIN